MRTASRAAARRIAAAPRHRRAARAAAAPAPPPALSDEGLERCVRSLLHEPLPPDDMLRRLQDPVLSMLLVEHSVEPPRATRRSGMVEELSAVREARAAATVELLAHTGGLDALPHAALKRLARAERLSMRVGPQLVAELEVRLHRS